MCKAFESKQSDYAATMVQIKLQVQQLEHQIELRDQKLDFNEQQHKGRQEEVVYLCYTLAQVI